MSQFSYDVDQSNFEQRVIEASRQVPVVIDFWAEWCGPCKALKPILEKLAEEYAGKFILAKIDSDRNQGLAAQFGVRGIPNVKAVVDGELVDEFSGALPESAVREFLDRLIPSPAEELRARATSLREAGQLAEALQVLGEASQLDPRNEAVRLDAAELLVEQGQIDEAHKLVASLSPAGLADERAQRLLARLSFSSVQGDEASLRATVATRPDDMQARWDLANWLIAQGRHGEGLDELLAMIERNRYWNDDAARKQVLTVFNLLGPGELVSTYRRRLASVLN
jgi:putative thioredoxin